METFTVFNVKTAKCHWEELCMYQRVLGKGTIKILLFFFIKSLFLNFRLFFSFFLFFKPLS